MAPSQRLGRFAIPFRVPLLFSPRMARVTAAGTSSREDKRCPRMGSFNLGNKSKSGGLMPGLHGGWGNTSHSYLANRSQPSPGAGVHCRAKWLAHPWASQVGFCAFLCAIFASSHNNTLLDDLLQESLPQVSHFVHLVVFQHPVALSQVFFIWCHTVLLCNNFY
jgi:hypothetical protein